MPIAKSELILNDDGSIYHLKLKPGDVASTIITVGDPERVNMITRHFDKVLFEISNREFKTVTGEMNGKPVSVVATGIGTDNIDIVFNELDALFNVNFETRELNKEHQSIEFIRIGTSGTIREDIAIDSTVVSAYAIGLDGLLNFYEDKGVRNKALEDIFHSATAISSPYAVEASEKLVTKFKPLGLAGITTTATGFYGPQSRNIRLQAKYQLPSLLADVRYNNLKFTNLEMETAGIYGLGKLLGHEAISINAILANRVNGAFSSNPAKTIDKLIRNTLEVIVS